MRGARFAGAHGPTVGVAVAVWVGVAVGVAVGAAVGVGVAVGVALGDGVAEGVTIGLGDVSGSPPIRSSESGRPIHRTATSSAARITPAPARVVRERPP
jgi:hypothetical protein